MLVRYEGNQQTDICASKFTSHTHNLQRAEAWASSEIARFRQSYIVVNTQKAGFSSLRRFHSRSCQACFRICVGVTARSGRCFFILLLDNLELIFKEAAEEEVVLHETPVVTMCSSMNHISRFSQGLRKRGVCKPDSQQHSACSSYFWVYWVHTQQTGDHLAGSPVDRHFISKADLLCTKCQPCWTYVAKFACTLKLCLLWKHFCNIICNSTFPPYCNSCGLGLATNWSDLWNWHFTNEELKTKKACTVQQRRMGVEGNSLGL